MLAPGAMPLPQFEPVVQLLSPPPPVQVTAKVHLVLLPPSVELPAMPSLTLALQKARVTRFAFRVPVTANVHAEPGFIWTRLPVPPVKDPFPATVIARPPS